MKTDPNLSNSRNASRADKDNDPVALSDLIPKEVRDFIRLQNEKAGRETGEITFMIPDEIIEEKYLQPGTRLRKLSKKEKDDYMKRFLVQMEEFCTSLFQTYSHARDVKSYYQRVRNDINAILETLDDKTIKKIMPKVTGYKSELDVIHDTILRHKQTLRNPRGLTDKDIRDIYDDLRKQAEDIPAINNRFRKRVAKNITPAAASSAATIAALALGAHHNVPDILSAMQGAAEDHTPHYHAPVDEAMPLRFSTASAKPRTKENAPQTRPAETEEIA